jgi:hypothetical protein
VRRHNSWCKYYKGIEISYMFYSCDDRNDYNDNRKRGMIVTGLNILYITININYFYIMGVYGCRLIK